jgi:hypothetical protein
MEEFKDPTLLSRVATGMLAVYAVSEAFVAIMFLIDPAPTPAVGVAAIVYVAALVACCVVVGMWIYRTNANAHVFSTDMTITPGWSVGWFFVPFANLVMPFRGVKETWQESHEAAGRFEEVESPLLGWWWGLWIAGNIASSVFARLGGYDQNGLEMARYLNLAAAAMNVAASLVLIQLMRRLNSAQLAASRGSVFA